MRLEVLRVVGVVGLCLWLYVYDIIFNFGYWYDITVINRNSFYVLIDMWICAWINVMG